MAKDKPAATPKPTPAPLPAPELFKARVLATSAFGAIDEVVELPADALAQGVAAGHLDPHPDAVAYATSLK
jgi:hypothetical protein